jgi:hypothetical protein
MRLKRKANRPLSSTAVHAPLTSNHIYALDEEVYEDKEDTERSPLNQTLNNYLNNGGIVVPANVSSQIKLRNRGRPRGIGT